MADSYHVGSKRKSNPKDSSSNQITSSTSHSTNNQTSNRGRITSNSSNRPYLTLSQRPIQIVNARKPRKKYTKKKDKKKEEDYSPQIEISPKIPIEPQREQQNPGSPEKEANPIEIIEETLENSEIQKRRIEAEITRRNERNKIINELTPETEVREFEEGNAGIVISQDENQPLRKKRRLSLNTQRNPSKQVNQEQTNSLIQAFENLEIHRPQRRNSSFSNARYAAETIQFTRNQLEIQGIQESPRPLSLTPTFRVHFSQFSPSRNLSPIIEYSPQIGNSQNQTSTFNIEQENISQSSFVDNLLGEQLYISPNQSLERASSSVINYFLEKDDYQLINENRMQVREEQLERGESPEETVIWVPESILPIIDYMQNMNIIDEYGDEKGVIEIKYDPFASSRNKLYSIGAGTKSAKKLFLENYQEYNTKYGATRIARAKNMLTKNRRAPANTESQVRVLKVHKDPITGIGIIFDEEGKEYDYLEAEQTTEITYVVSSQVDSERYPFYVVNLFTQVHGQCNCDDYIYRALYNTKITNCKHMFAARFKMSIEDRAEIYVMSSSAGNRYIEATTILPEYKDIESTIGRETIQKPLKTEWTDQKGPFNGLYIPSTASYFLEHRNQIAELQHVENRNIPEEEWDLKITNAVDAYIYHQSVEESQYFDKIIASFKDSDFYRTEDLKLSTPEERAIYSMARLLYRSDSPERKKYKEFFDVASPLYFMINAIKSEGFYALMKATKKQIEAFLAKFEYQHRILRFNALYYDYKYNPQRASFFNDQFERYLNQSAGNYLKSYQREILIQTEILKQTHQTFQNQISDSTFGVSVRDSQTRRSGSQRNNILQNLSDEQMEYEMNVLSQRNSLLTMDADFEEILRLIEGKNIESNIDEIAKRLKDIPTNQITKGRSIPISKNFEYKKIPSVSNEEITNLSPQVNLSPLALFNKNNNPSQSSPRTLDQILSQEFPYSPPIEFYSPEIQSLENQSKDYSQKPRNSSFSRRSNSGYLSESSNSSPSDYEESMIEDQFNDMRRINNNNNNRFIRQMEYNDKKELERIKRIDESTRLAKISKSLQKNNQVQVTRYNQKEIQQGKIDKVSKSLWDLKKNWNSSFQFLQDFFARFQIKCEEWKIDYAFDIQSSRSRYSIHNKILFQQEQFIKYWNELDHRCSEIARHFDKEILQIDNANFISKSTSKIEDVCDTLIKTQQELEKLYIEFEGMNNNNDTPRRIMEEENRGKEWFYQSKNSFRRIGETMKELNAIKKQIDQESSIQSRNVVQGKI